MRTYYNVNLTVNEADFYADFLRSNDFYFETSSYFDEYVHFEMFLSENEADICDRFLKECVY